MDDSHTIIGSVTCKSDKLSVAGIAITVSEEGEIVLGLYGKDGFFVQYLKENIRINANTARFLSRLLAEAAAETKP